MQGWACCVWTMSLKALLVRVRVMVRVRVRVRVTVRFRVST